MCTKGHGSVTGDRCAYGKEVYEPRFTYLLRGIFILLTADYSVGCLYHLVTAGQISFLLEQVPWFSIRAG